MFYGSCRFDSEVVQASHAQTNAAHGIVGLLQAFGKKLLIGRPCRQSVATQQQRFTAFQNRQDVRCIGTV